MQKEQQDLINDALQRVGISNDTQENDDGDTQGTDNQAPNEQQRLVDDMLQRVGITKGQ